MSKRKGRTARNRLSKHVNKSGCETSKNNDYGELLKWMKRKFHFTSKLLRVVNFSQTGRGMMARKPIHSGEQIISIPRAALIGVKQAFRDSILLKAIECHHKCSRNFKIIGSQALCVFLIEEKRKRSLLLSGISVGKWSPYVQVLPSHFTHSLYWETATLNLLPELIREDCKNIRKRFKEEWISVNHLIVASKGFVERLCGNTLLTNLLCEGFTYDEYIWAWCCVNTRCVYSDHDELNFDCLFHGESDKYFLVPLLDLLNHADDADVKASFNKSTQHFEITSFTNYRKYDQVFIHYGNHSNAKLMVEYGFVVPEEINKNDVVAICWETIVGCFHFSHQELITIKSFLSKRFLCIDWCYGYDGPSWSLVTTVLVFVLASFQILKLHNIDHFTQVELSANQAKDLLLKVQEILSFMAQNKLQFIDVQIKKCLQKRSCVAFQEIQHLEIVTAFWKICKKVITSSVHCIQHLDLSHCDAISIK